MVHWVPHGTRVSFNFILATVLPCFRAHVECELVTLLFQFPRIFSFAFLSRFWFPHLRLFGWDGLVLAIRFQMLVPARSFPTSTFLGFLESPFFREEKLLDIRASRGTNDIYLAFIVTKITDLGFGFAVHKLLLTEVWRHLRHRC